MTRKSRINTFCREEHLKRRSEIQAVFKVGRRYYNKNGSVLFVLKNKLPYNRICFTPAGGRKFGNAVARNRAKRLAREAYRLLKNKLACGYDFILLIRTMCPPKLLSYLYMVEELQFLYKKAGLLK